MNSTVRQLLVVWCLFLLLAFFVWAMWQVMILPFDQLAKDCARWIYWSLLDAFQYWVGPIALLALPAFLAASAFFPADSAQPVLSKALAQDALWTMFNLLFFSLVVGVYTIFLVGLFDKFFYGLKFDFVLSLPSYVRAIVGVVLADLLFWVRHYILHKVPVFWQFHAVHHSQMQLNPLTRHRVHPIESLISLNIRFVPMYALQNSLDVIVAFHLINNIHDYFSHSNIRTNLGPLRHVFVTPQYHRIHHSRLVEHCDSNYGTVLSIWDWIFGTQSRDSSTYPPVGIQDPSFPVEQARVGAGRTLLAQLVYPFVEIARRSTVPVPLCRSRGR